MHICAMAHIRKYVFSLTHHKNLFDLFGPPKTSKHILRIMKYILQSGLQKSQIIFSNYQLLT